MMISGSWPSSVYGQETLVPLPPTSTSNAPTADGAIETITLEKIEAWRRDAAASNLDEETKKTIDELYQQAAASLQRSAELARKSEAFQRDIETVQERKARIEQRIAELRATKPQIPDSTNLKQYEQQLAALEPKLAELQAAQQKAEAEPANRTSRRNEIPKLLASATTQIQEIEKQLAELASRATAGEAPQVTQARRVELITRRAALEREIPALKNELAKYDAEDAAGLVQLLRDLAVQEVRAVEREREILDSRIKLLREQEARDAVKKAQMEAINAQPLLKEHVERNKVLTELNQELTEKVRSTDGEVKVAQETLEDLRDRFSAARKRVETIGLTRSVGATLRKEKAELPPLRSLKLRIRQRQQLIDDTRYTIFELDAERAQLADLEAIVEDVLAQAPPTLSDFERESLRAAATDVLNRKREYLDNLLRNYNVYFDALTLLDATEQQVVNLTGEFSTYIDERILWIRSSKSLTSGIVVSDADWQLLDVKSWLGVTQSIFEDVKTNPHILAIVILPIIILLAAGQRLRRRITDLSTQVRRPTCVIFRPTLQTLILTLIVSLPWPLIATYISWRLSVIAGDSMLLAALARGSAVLAVILFPMEILRQTCRHDGLAEAHFEWPANAIRSLRNYLKLLMAFLLPVVFLTVVLRENQEVHVQSNIWRLGFVVGALVASFFAAQILHPTRGILREYVAYHRDGWIDRLKLVWYWLAVSTPLVLALLVVIGYDYTAGQLTWRVFQTVALIVAVILLRAVLMRWLLVYRRKLSIQQARERRAAMAAADGESALPVVEDDTANLSQISSQTQRLVTLAVLLAILCGFWAIWDDVSPALSILDRWQLWTTTAVVSEQTTGADGNLQTVTRDVVESITIFNLLIATFVGMVTVIAFRNIPGLVELAILQRLPLDASIRYAITRLASYAIIFIGILVGGQTLGFRWSQIQWLATALTFGLAFGMQEIFANFVAGLIILFERPLRVGDVVTIDNVTGVVSRVRIRATTITDWDRKEYVVPNKEFITGRLLNWTLSDHTNRIVIKVGVAYGSDTELARDLLLDIANKHPLILDDPAPMATFEGFGDSALDLVLRAYLPNMDNRLNTIHQLHTEIHRRFAEEGIEIAFPQLDVHLFPSETAQNGTES